MKRVLASALLVAAMVLPARAEVQTLRVGVQFGLGYLPVYVMRDAGLLDAELKKAGLPPVPVDIHNFTGAPDIGDGLLSGSLDIGGGGITAMMVAWDKTKSAGERSMRGIVALSAMPYELLTNNPDMKTLADITDKDRIGLPAVKVSFPAVMLQIAAERQFGAGKHDRLNAMTVGLAGPEGATALLTNNGVVDGYTFAAPFIQQLRGKPGIHKVWSSTDVFGTPTTALATWTTERFRTQNPKTYAAFFAAMHEANRFIAEHPDQAAAIYLKAEQSKLPLDLIVECIKDPSMAYNTAPQNSGALSDFLARIGTLKQRPASWKDLFFPEVTSEQGS
ncbi:ABC transporter substrate-binding protein [Roseixanthobacter glucoisosaccharinicivorans]|uniref:ABC transporter substrate-binding protein n=1 Tax=Roseixanthobacter glucoisosaccharinicivorans TaxID=3119923 RepID=UPI00372CB344